MENHQDYFKEWLKSPHGKSCSDDSEIVKNPYLTNRLWWAFQAGESKNYQYINMKAAIHKSFKKIAEMRKELRAKDKRVGWRSVDLWASGAACLWLGQWHITVRGYAMSAPIKSNNL